MISAVVKDAAGSVVYTISFQGFELFLGSVLGGIAAVVIWITLKNFAK